MRDGAFQFTPTALPPDVLDRRTVARDELLQRIGDRIVRAAGHQGIAHTLVIGSRGSGKTHLLTVAAHRARSEVDATRLLIVSVTEDAEGIVSYADLLYTVIERALHGGAADRKHNDELLHRARSARRAPTSLESMLDELVGDRVLVVVIENLNRVFDDLGGDGRERLRAFVEQRRAVMLLASTPLLFDAVSNRDEAWFGSFTPEHLGDIDAEHGAKLLTHLARERGDDKLAVFLQSDTAVDRLHAVHHVAGGSARIWVMLSGCVSVERLDSLVPLVEQLMEELVPYYKARIEELAGNERKLVVELARTSMVSAAGEVRFQAQGARTAKDLANASGIDPDVARTSLRRLLAARWVREQAVPGGDRRSTWYELREPLFRHYLQHRETGDGSLALIVSLLRAWYAEPQRIRMLGSLPDGGRAVEPLLASLEAPPASDSGYGHGDPDELLGEAHRWDSINTALGPVARDVARAVVAAARGEHADAANAPTIAAAAAGANAASANTGDEGQRIAAGLVAAADAAPADPDCHAELTLLAAGWLGSRGHNEAALKLLQAAPTAATDRLRLSLGAELGYFGFLAGDRKASMQAVVRAREERAQIFGETDPDTLTSRHNVAYQLGELGEHVAARDALHALLADSERALGPDHRDTLTARHGLAYQLGALGERAAARDAFQALLADRERVLGPDHRDTLATRHSLAYQLGELGERAAARDAFQALLADREQVLGPDHRDTLATRHSLAYQLGALGEHAAARDAFQALLADRERVLGPDHRDTLATRHNLAYQLGELGERAAARDAFQALLADRERALGPDHPDTLATRHNVAYQLGELGERAAARDAFQALLADRERALGPDHPDTLATRHGHAYQLGALGERAAARDALQALLADSERALGPDHPDTLTTRHGLAYQLGELGEHAAARDAFQALLADRERALGPDHPNTLTTRHGLAYQLGALGEHAAARDAFQALLADHQRALGPDHPNTITTRHNLAWMHAITGRARAAIDDALAVAATHEAGPVISLAIRHIADPTEAWEVLKTMRDNGSVGDPAAIVVASARDGVGDQHRDRWLAAWATALDDSPAGRLLAAAARLLDGDAAPAAVLPDEERRLAELIAGARTTRSDAP